MRQTTRDALLTINRRFYQRHAETFARTRNAPWPGWARVVDSWLADAPETPRARVLDAGCGNGRFLRYLDTKARDVVWSGLAVDGSLPLLLCTRATTRQVSCVRFEFGLGTGGAPWRRQRFDLVVAFGLLHHVPSSDARFELVQELAASVAPHGLLALTCWRRTVLQRRETLSWGEYDLRSPETIDVADLEDGDVLLRWGDDEGATATGRFRYCHLFDDAEVEQLADALMSFEVTNYDSDGPGGDDNRYLLARRNR